jgi:hypothetical protein
MKNVFKALTLCLLMAFMTSCTTQEEKVISKMQALAERIENQTGSFTEDEWKSINDEFESLQAQAGECEFTTEQKADYAKAEAEVTAAIIAQRAKEVGNGIQDAIEEGKEIINGIFDGIKEGFGIGDEASEEAPTE